MTLNPQTSGKVKAQYEELPYPHRNPEDEKRRLLTPFGNCLDFLNQACFGGAKDFTKPVRVLIAGGGTGDAAVFWAENLRDNPHGEIIYLDFSEASRKVAENRLAVRGLSDKVNMITDSLLNIPKLGLGEFDVINCSGVLHHLERPEAGLEALATALKNEGAMNLMLYGKYGRYGIYPMQETMRIINSGAKDRNEKIDNTYAMLKSLPMSNYFVQNYRSISNFNDRAEIYDLFLHDQDRAYSIPEVYDFVASAGLQVAQFFIGAGVGRISDLMPRRYIGNRQLLDKIEKLPLPRQHAIAEIYNSHMTKHAFYAVRKMPPVIEYGPDVIPSFSVIFPREHNLSLAAQLRSGTETIEMKINRVAVRIKNSPNLVSILEKLDGRKSLGEILAPIGPAQELLNEFRPFYENMHDHYMMFLRQKHVPPYETAHDMHAKTGVAK